ncbi:MAG: SAM-dependent chlorinase/fluorinase [Crocinitomicaceae bacterium]|nr:SAM-dependent chlorinase/fluorinase [Crocinitomicaceae bacterium]
MAIITLISDLGTTDHYVAAVKASIYSIIPQANVVDISHHISPFDIHEAAFLLGSVWRQFPLGSVHIIGINSEIKTNQIQVVVQYMGHYFIGADNGIFSLLLDEIPEDIFEITLDQGSDWAFPMKGVFATAAAHLARGGAPEFLGKRTHTLKYVLPSKPSIDESSVVGHIVHIDHYGNLYTNIKRETFDIACRGRDFKIELTRHRYSINRISHSFSDVQVAEQVALWATNDYLLLAMNASTVGYGGGAAKLWGMEKKDHVRIIFID